MFYKKYLPIREIIGRYYIPNKMFILFCVYCNKVGFNILKNDATVLTIFEDFRDCHKNVRNKKTIRQTKLDGKRHI